MTLTAAPIGAADLKFLHLLRRVRVRNFKSKIGTKNIGLRVPRFRSSFRRGRNG